MPHSRSSRSRSSRFNYIMLYIYILFEHVEINIIRAGADVALKRYYTSLQIVACDVVIIIIIIYTSENSELNSSSAALVSVRKSLRKSRISLITGSIYYTYSYYNVGIRGGKRRKTTSVENLRLVSYRHRGYRIIYIHTRA